MAHKTVKFQVTAYNACQILRLRVFTKPFQVSINNIIKEENIPRKRDRQTMHVW